MISENSGDIVLTNGEYLSKYSSEVIKKGLSLAKQKRLQNNISKLSNSNSKAFQCLYKIRLPMREDGQKKLSPNGKILATADRWGIVNIWNVSDGDLIGSLDPGYEQKPLPENSYDDWFYNKYKNHGANYSIEFSTKTEELVGMNPESKKIMIWNYITGKKTWEYEYDYDFSFDTLNINNDQVIDLVDDWQSDCSIVRIINLDIKENIDIVVFEKSGFCFDVWSLSNSFLSKKFNILAISGQNLLDYSDNHENDNGEEWWVYENSIKIVNLATNLLLHTLDEYVYKYSSKGDIYDPPSIKLSNNGRFLISIDRYLYDPKTSYEKAIDQFKVWDIESGKIVYHSQADDCLDTEMLEISSNGKLIIYDDSKIEVIDIYSQKCQYFDSNGSYRLHESSKVFLITETNDSRIQVWNLENGNLIFSIADNKIVKTISYGNDEKNLVTHDNNDNKIKLWNLENGDCVQILSEHRSQIPAIELIDNGETFLYIDNGEEIELWKLSYGHELIPSKTIKCNTEKMIDSLIQIGDDRYNLSNYDGAIYSYTKAIDIDPDNADTYNKRSTARSANGDIKGAVEDLLKAQQLLKN
ncbi:MAG: tetratricopeptide repeat protein [Microcystis aeruginosa L211-07]|nr:tetratricopeptide repeat protein [Microcystis aeruginosa L211-07]